MKALIGRIATGKVTDENEKAYFVQIEGVTYELPKLELTQDEKPQAGSLVQGFIYANQHQKMMMTQFLPVCGPDEYGWATVTEVRRDLGVFVDVGLKDKDMVVSLDDLPAQTQQWPRRGDRLLVRLQTDQKDRIWAKPADENIFDQLSQSYPDDLKNYNLTVTVYASREIGAFVISSDYYLGFIHISQSYRPLRLGEQVKARVIGNSKYGRLNLSVLPRSYEEIDDDAQMILVSLRRTSEGRLPFSDKSSPEEIKQHFGISKAAFKRALGHLIKEKLIVQDKQRGEISLREKDLD